MLGKHNIVALSPELGTLDPNSDTSFIESYELLRSVIMFNSKWVFEVASMALSQLQINTIKGTYYDNHIELHLSLKNRGLVDII